LVEYTNAKNPKDFCNGYKPKVPEIPVQIVEQFHLNQHRHQLPAQQNEQFVFDPSQQYKARPAHGNEYYVFDSSLQYLQPLTQHNERPDFDLNLQPSVSTPSVYSGEYPFFDCNQTRASISYVDYDKSPSFDLNKSPPID